MALASTMVFEIRQGGADTNGGGFNPARGGTDYTLQNSPLINVADGTTTSGSATVTSPTANFPADCVGNMISISGNGAFYEIIARGSASSITIDRNASASVAATATLIVGGAWATPGRISTAGAGGVLVSGQKAWVKYNATPYNCSSTTAGGNGPCSIVTSIAMIVEGYDVTRGDRTANRPVYQWSTAAAAAYTYVAVGGARQAFVNLAADSNGNSANGFNVSAARTEAIDCVATGCTIGALLSSGTARRCAANSCTTGFSAGGGGSARYCAANGCTTGFSSVGNLFKCVSYGSSVTTGFTFATSSSSADQCTSDGATTGFNTSSIQVDLANSLASNCTNGFTVAGSSTTMTNCAVYNCTTAVNGTPFANIGLVTCSSDPYVNRAGGDFRPNGTAGGGLSLWAAGIDVNGQTAQQDIGACQHADPAGAAGILVYRGLNGGLSG